VTLGAQLAPPPRGPEPPQRNQRPSGRRGALRL